MKNNNNNKQYKYTDLKFILDVFPTKKGWTDEKITKLISLLREGIIDFDKLAKATDMKRTGVQVIVQELKRAAREGHSLEGYLKKGRPLRNGKKVLA